MTDFSYRMGFYRLCGIIKEDLSTIKKLSFFDMDATLLNTIHPETGMNIYKEKTGQDWPHIGWWSKPETLDYKIFDIKPFGNVLNTLNNDNNDPSIFTVLLTARISKLDKEIKELLGHLNIKLDDYSLKSNSKEKDQRILDYLSHFPNVTEIDVYDDREKEFVLFIRLRDKLKESGIKLNIYKVDNDNISEL